MIPVDTFTNGIGFHAPRAPWAAPLRIVGRDATAYGTARYVAVDAAGHRSYAFPVAPVSPAVMFGGYR